MRQRFQLLLCCVGVCVLASGCKRDKAPPPDGVVVISKEQEATWIRNFNPLSPGVHRWPTRAGIYEPLLVFNMVKGQYVPWLASAYAFSDDALSLTFTIRDGVKWSDGQPFTPEDVVFTYELLRKFPACDRGGIWTRIEKVERLGQDVLFQFRKPYVPGLADVSSQPIVPKHIFETIQDPVSFTNPNPVATGPFTEVRKFSRRVYELGKNPHYWQEGRPLVDALRFPAIASNDQVLLALINGEIDWSGNFVPAIDRVFVEKDPDHNLYWYPPVGSTVFLYPNTAKAPYDDTRVRQALSMAIDRPLMVKVAAYGYTSPADGTGLSERYDAYRNAEIAKADWVQYAPQRAETLLDAAGYTRGEDGVRRDAQGEPLTPQILCVSGWSDWIRAAQVAASSLRAIGVKASVRLLDFSPWMEALQKGEFDLAVSWSTEGETPYGFYRYLMGTETVKPLGESAPANWHRFGNSEADGFLSTLETELDPAKRMAAFHGLQRIFAREAPAIPLFPNPALGVASTRRIVGWPTAENPYAILSPNNEPDALLVLTQIAPRGAAQ